MKNKKLLKAFGLADDKYVEEAAPTAVKVKNKRSRGLILAACICVMVTVLSLVLFLPYDNGRDNDENRLEKYKDSEYYELILKLDPIVGHYYTSSTDSGYVNLFDKLFSGVGGMDKNEVNADMAPMAPDADFDNNVSDGAEIPDGATGSYEEITDNQVAGVIEADLIKRSDKYIYYLDPTRETLFVYSIAGKDSERVAAFKINTNAYARLTYVNEWEFYLSKDCKTVTVVAPYYAQKVGSCVELISIDVSDVSNISVNKRVCVTGDHLSTRVTGGKIIVMTRFAVSYNPDYSDESDFLPQIGDGKNMSSLAPDKIFCPDVLADARYTVVSMLDEQTLEVKDSAAYLSYSEEAYVSESTVYVTRSYRYSENDGNVRISGTMTDIAMLSYSGETLEHVGTVSVDGYIKDQYSLDEYDGILRVVTTVDTRAYRIYTSPTMDSIANISGMDGTSASLWCIDLETKEICASVKNFAPAGETVQSVRFDKDKAYVCTAVVVTFTDPVFFFDLSDLDNITYTDTGDIYGYSSSLVNFGDGYLLGIGYGEDRGYLKIEIYAQGDKKVDSICSYEIPATFSEEYKSYYIDRENRLIGLGMIADGQMCYRVLHFDGGELKLAADVELDASWPEYARGVYIDDLFYIVAEKDFAVSGLFGK